MYFEYLQFVCIFCIMMSYFCKYFIGVDFLGVNVYVVLLYQKMYLECILYLEYLLGKKLKNLSFLPNTEA